MQEKTIILEKMFVKAVSEGHEQVVDELLPSIVEQEKCYPMLARGICEAAAKGFRFPLCAHPSRDS